MSTTPDDDNSLEFISKSQRKRDMRALQELGEQLTSLSTGELDKLNLPENLLNAIRDFQKITSRSAHKRQLQYIGKLMRDVDPEPIRRTLSLIQLQSDAGTKHFHILENWRDRLINEGDQALSELLSKHPDADRQQLRQLVRNAKKEKSRNDSPKAARAIFQYLRDLIQQDN